jgi:hypothetical protein
VARAGGGRGRSRVACGGLVAFAELVFAYIDQLSAASVAGHADEIAAEDRVRQRHLERLGHGLVVAAPAEAVLAAAERAGWTPPSRLAAVVLPDDRVDAVLARIDPRTLQPVDNLPDLGLGTAVLLVPDPDERLRSGLLRGLAGSPAVIGPARPWLQVAGSFERARRAWLLGLADAAARTSAGRLVDTEDVLPELLVGADLAALADLRARALAPLSGLRPATAERLAETLRAWLLHRGRREEVAAALFVHPQTVRYRVGQLRALFGDALDDPRMTLELTLALALPGPVLPGPVLPGPALPGPVATPEPPA